jgi:mannose-6-phosphate isomerase-like protein (cupin superfamily)
MKTIATAVLSFATLLALAPAFAQAPPPPPQKDAIDVTAAEQQKVAAAQKGVRYDSVIRVVDIGKYNMAIALTHHESPTPNASTHSGLTEVYIVTSGSGTLTTGGTIPDAKPSSGNALPTGPGTGGAKIEGGRSRHMGPGDIAIIPPNVPHAWTEVTPPLNVLVVRSDAEHVLPSGYENPALKQ